MLNEKSRNKCAFNQITYGGHTVGYIIITISNKKLIQI